MNVLQLSLIPLLCLAKTGSYFILELADYPALPAYLFIPIFYQTGKGMNSIYSVKSK
jgi:hypothetical protein